MKLQKLKNRIKQVVIVLKFIPILIDKLKEVWDITKEYYNEETMKELQEIAKKKGIKE